MVFSKLAVGGGTGPICSGRYDPSVSSFFAYTEPVTRLGVLVLFPLGGNLLLEISV